MKIHIERFGKVERKRHNVWKPFLITVLGFITLFIIIKFALSFEQSFLKKAYCYHLKENEATWVSSLSSYWGGVIGGIISGFLSLIGIIITINYYRKSDIDRKISERLPYFRLNMKCESNSGEDALFCLNRDKKLSAFVECEMKNIGKGFAQILTYNTGSTIGGNGFNKLVEAGEVVKKFNFSISNENAKYRIAVNFFDEFRNEYIQEFEISSCESTNTPIPNIEIQSYYPEIIQKEIR